MTRSEEFMKRAIELSLMAAEDGLGGPFGAVIVYKGREISQGRNLVLSTKDPTAHAEIVAIRQAADYLNSYILRVCPIRV